MSMKNYYVYELVNLMGTVEYVGNTCDLKRRLQQHINRKKSKKEKNGHGKFYGRQDLSMHVVSGHPTKSEARSEEMKLQSFWGFKNESQKIGESRTGSKHPLAKLTDSDVIKIKKMLKAGIPQDKIAENFSVRWTSISLIKNGKAWSHITI